MGFIEMKVNIGQILHYIAIIISIPKNQCLSLMKKRYKKPFEDAMGLFKVKYNKNDLARLQTKKYHSGYLTHFILKLEDASFYLDDH